MISIFSEFEYLRIFGLWLISIGFVLLLRRRTSLNVSPLVPYKYPIIGHTFEYYKDVPGFLKKCHDEYGEIFSLYILGNVQTYVGSKCYHEMIRNHRDFDFHKAFDDTFPLNSFLNRPENYFKFPLNNYTKELFQNWNRFGEIMQHEIIKSLDDLIGDGKVVQPLLKTIQQVIARPIATIFSKELSKDKELRNTFENVTTDLGSWLSIPPVLNFIYPGLHKKYITYKFRYFNNPIKTHRKVILSTITPIINQRIADKNKLGNSWNRPDDILQDLMERRSKDSVNHVDIESVADFIMCFIFASVHNTSTTLAQCLSEYINHPEYHEGLLEEAERIYSENKNLSYYTHDIIDKMEKLDNFIKETLRINKHHTTFPHKTIPTKFTFANGYLIPKGRNVHIITQYIHFDQEIYGSNPKNFNPNHHINSPSTRPERNFLAFGMGKLMCPGRVFAVNEVKVAMHFILLKYNIRSVSGKRIEPKIKGSYVLVSDEGLIFEKRKDNIM